MADEQTQTQTDDKPKADKKFKTKTYWLPGPAPLYPNPRIPVPGTRRLLHFRNGNLTVLTEQEDELVQSAHIQVYEEDISRSRKVKPCPHCGYAPYSSEAREAHEELHPSPANSV